MNLAPRPAGQDLRLSVVLPVFNESAVLAPLHESLVTALRRLGCRGEFLYINDGSTDDSGEVLDRLAGQNTSVRVVHLSRNFGQQAAVQAGLSHATGDVVVVMDADSQDDPAAIDKLLNEWRKGYDVVYAIRIGRKESLPKRLLFYAFYRLLNWISQMPLPMDAGNFGLVDGRIARAIASLPDRDRYYPGLRRWVGFRQTGVEVERGARHDGKPKVTLLGLCRLAKTAIFSFSSLPLTMFYAIAAIATLAFLWLASFTLYHKLVTGEAILGWTSTIMTACFFGALNSLGIAVLGEYVWRIYDQVRGRPLYVIDRTVNFDAREEPGP